MSKRQAEFQIHNQPMSEAETRAANMMNNQAPSRATAAQMAQRKIREAKGSLRRHGRAPGISPAPNALSNPNPQSAPSPFAGINTSKMSFGTTPTNGVQQSPFVAPSASTFNFSASSSSNPFATPGFPNSFSTQATPNPFMSQSSIKNQQPSVFGQTQTPQTTSNPFGASNTFNLGTSTGASNSFPPTQSNSIFSKPTPASSSSIFGTSSVYPSETPAPTFAIENKGKTNIADSDMAMDVSAGSPFKSPAKPVTSEQSVEIKPPPPIFGTGAAGFSLKATTHNEAKDQEAQPFNPFNTSTQSKNSPATQQTSTVGSGFFSSLKAPELGTPKQQIPQSPTPIFNFLAKPSGLDVQTTPSPALSLFGAPKSAEKDTSATSASSIFGPPRFVETVDSQHNESQIPPSSALSIPGVQKSAATATVHETKSQTPLPFGGTAFPQVDLGKSFMQKDPDASPLDPSRQGPAMNGGTASHQLQELNSNSSLSSAALESNHAGPEKPQASIFQSLRPNSGEDSQSPLSSFQPTKAAEYDTPTGTPSEASGMAGNVQHGFKPAANITSSISQTSPEPASASVSTTPGRFKDSFESAATEELAPAPKSSTPTVSYPFLQTGRIESGTKTGSPFAISPTKNSSNIMAQPPGQYSMRLPSSIAFPAKSTFDSANGSGMSQPLFPAKIQAPLNPGSAVEKPSSNLPASTAITTEPLLCKVKSHGASNIPQELGFEDFAEFDKAYRLRSLNEKFQKEIAALDPTKHDFESAIRFYAAQREVIGYPLGGLYHRVKAGAKRKITESRDNDDAPNPAKRSKSNTSVPRAVEGGGSATSVDLTGPTSQLTASQNNLPASDSFISYSQSGSVTQPATNSSTTSNVFRSMLSSSIDQSPDESSKTIPKALISPKADSTLSPFKSLEKRASAAAPTSSAYSMPPVFKFVPEQENKNEVNSSVNSTSSGTTSAQSFLPKTDTSSSLELPKFASAGGADFMATFAAQAQKNAEMMNAENRAKRKAEDFDSDEDDEEEYERKAAEEERAKRAKLLAMSKPGSGFTPVLSSASSSNGASPGAEKSGASSGESSDKDSHGSRFGSEANSTNGESGEEHRSQDQSETEEQDEADENAEEDDIQAAMAKSHARPTDANDSSSDSNSLFNRITRPDGSPVAREAGNGPTSPSTPSAIKSPFSGIENAGLFGSGQNTPKKEIRQSFGTSIFGNLGSTTPTADHTWKPGSEIKFGAGAFAPAVNVIPASPLAKTNGDTNKSGSTSFSADPTPTAFKSAGERDEDDPKGPVDPVGVSSLPVSSTSIFGANSEKPFSTLFGDAPKKTAASQSSAAPIGFSFGAPPKPGASPFLAPSDASSALTSRATSPGLTDNDSVASSAPDDQSNDAQSDLMTARPGEEDEDVVFAIRTKALEYMTQQELEAVDSEDEKGWKTRGLGPIRILKNPETGRVRIVMRSEPGGNVVVNSSLVNDNKYDVNPSGKQGASLKMGVFTDGKLKNWVFKTKTIAIAEELVKHLKENEPQAK